MSNPLDLTSSVIPPAFDQERAGRLVEEFAPEAGALLDDPARRALLRSVAGNSPYLARSMLKG